MLVLGGLKASLALLVAMLAIKAAFGSVSTPCPTCGETPKAADGSDSNVPKCAECAVCLPNVPCPTCDQTPSVACPECKTCDNSERDALKVQLSDAQSQIVTLSAKANSLDSCVTARTKCDTDLATANTTGAKCSSDLNNWQSKYSVDMSDYATQVAKLNEQIGLTDAKFATCGVTNTDLQSQIAALKTANACVSGTVVNNMELGWRHCMKCSAIRMKGAGDMVCAAGGTHSTTGSYMYMVPIQFVPMNGVSQPGWKMCHQCSELVWGGHLSGCVPVGSGPRNHDFSRSADYSVYYGATKPSGLNTQDGFRYCTSCGCLGYAGPTANSSGKCSDNNGGAHTYLMDNMRYMVKESEAVVAD